MARTKVSLFALLALGLLADCGSGNGSSDGSPTPNVPVAEVELNDTSGTATALSATSSGSGEIDIGDQDWWSFTANAGTTIRVELHAIRFAQATWDANANRPILTLFDGTGATKLLEHVWLAESTVGVAADLDFPAFHVPVTGTYFLRVMGESTFAWAGGYVLVVKTISLPAPFQTEGEAPLATGANDGFGTAQAIVPGTVFGWHVDDNADWYSFDITAPSIVSFEILASRNGLSHGDANMMNLELELYKPNGTSLVRNNGTCFLDDPGLTHAIQTPGTYFLRVLDVAGIGNGEYFLFYSRVGTPIGPTETEPNDVLATANQTNYNAVSFGNIVPGDTDLYEFFGQAGDVVAVQTYDAANADGAMAGVTVSILDAVGVPLPSNAGPHLAVTRAVLQSTGNHHVQVTGAGATPYWFRLLRLFGSTRESEANGTTGTANPLGSSNTISGVINGPGDQDQFSFGAAAGEVVTIHCYGGIGLNTLWAEQDFDRFGSPLSPRLRIYDPTLVQVAIAVRSPTFGFVAAQSMTDGLASVSVTFVAATAGTYVVNLDDQPGGGGPSFVYVLERR